MHSLRFYILAALTFFTPDLFGHDIFLSPGGNDQNPGTKTQPLSSLSGALKLIRQLRSSGEQNERIRVIVGNGMYFMNEPLMLTEADSGTETAPLSFIAEEGASPIFNGGMRIKNWEKISDKVWRAKIPEVARYGFYFEQLYVNGQWATRAKSPNQGFYFLKSVKETIISKSKNNIADMAVQGLAISPEAAADVARFSKSDFDNVVLTLYHKWDNTRKRVLGFNSDSSTIYTGSKGMKPWNSFDRQTHYTIENFKAALDTANEWFLDRNGDLYYMPADGENPNQLNIYAPVIDRFITLQGNPETGRKVRNIHFENLRFEVAGYRMPLFGNEPAQAAAPVEATIMADFASNIGFRNCEVSQTGANAIWFQKACTDCSIQHCYLHDLGAGGIKIGDIQIPKDQTELTQRIKADNNIIRSGGYIFPCAAGVTIFQASDNKISHNEIANFRYSGISVGWVWGYSYSPSKRNQIEFNHIHHLGWGELSDMGGVYCLGESEGTTVRNNVVHHVYSFDYGGWGLYTDEGSTGILMENNLVYACKHSAFHQHYGKDNIIRNNIFAANIYGQLQATRKEEHLSFSFTNNIIWFNTGNLLVSNWDKIEIQSDYNCYWDTRTKDVRFSKLSFQEWQKAGKDRHSIIADPEFANPQLFDFRINNKALMKKIRFKPFDYSLAGVYGSEEWKKLAVLDKKIEEKFKAVELNGGL